jgi:c-di-GMP-binding flagellar brake protein YcgR
MFTMSLTKPPERVQRRGDFRLEIAAPGEVVYEDVEGGEMAEIRVPIVTVDISGGGVMIKSPRRFPDSVECRIWIMADPESEPWEYKAQLLWQRPVNIPGSKLSVEAGLRFLHGSNFEKEELSKAIFRKQIEQRRRKKLT